MKIQIRMLQLRLIAVLRNFLVFYMLYCKIISVPQLSFSNTNSLNQINSGGIKKKESKGEKRNYLGSELLVVVARTTEKRREFRENCER
jgi:hypothetical protein